MTIASTHNKEDEKGQIYTVRLSEAHMMLLIILQVYIIAVESRKNEFVPWFIGRRFSEFVMLDTVVCGRIRPFAVIILLALASCSS